MSPRSHPSTPFHMNIRRRGKSPKTPFITPPTPEGHGKKTSTSNASNPSSTPKTPSNNASESTSPITPRKSSRSKKESTSTSSASPPTASDSVGKPLDPPSPNSLPEPRCNERKEPAPTSSTAPIPPQPPAEGASASISSTLPPTSRPHATINLSEAHPDPSIDDPPTLPSTRSKHRSPSKIRPPRNLDVRQQAAIAKKPALKPKYERMAVLKARFAGISKQIKPALRELATRSEQRLRENHSHEPVIETLARDLEENLKRNKVHLLLEKNLRLEQHVREHEQITGALELAAHRRIEDIRTEMLAHAKLDLMTAIYERETPDGEKRGTGPNLGQGPSNERRDWKAVSDGRSTAYHVETQRRGKEEFYRTTDRMWDDWTERLDALGSDASAREMKRRVVVLPRPWKQIGSHNRGDEGARDGQMGAVSRQDGEVHQTTQAAVNCGNYVRGIIQTKASKQGEGFVAKGAEELKMREERLRKIRERRMKRGDVAESKKEKGGKGKKGGKRGKGR